MMEKKDIKCVLYTGSLYVNMPQRRYDGVGMCGVRTCRYLLGSVASAEKSFTVFPAAPQRLEAGTDVVGDQVLVQMFHHPEHQRAAVPL